jgi:integrase
MPALEKRRFPVDLLGKIHDGRVRLERLATSKNISARAFIQGKLIRKSTCETTLGAATRVARDWYEHLLARKHNGEDIHGLSFAAVAEKFLAHADEEAVVSVGQRKNYRDKWHLLRPHFAGVKVKDVDAAFLTSLRRKRASTVTKRGTSVMPATLKKDLLFVSAVLRHAKNIEKCLPELPAFPTFEGTFSIEKRGRPYLDDGQYKKLRELAKQRAEEADLNPRTRRQRQELNWFIRICVGGALRVGEAQSVRWRDCELVELDKPDGTSQEAVQMLVLGKHSKGGQREFAYAMFEAIVAFKEMRAARPDAKPDDKLFLENHRDGIKELLTIAELRTDARTGRTRDAKSLRPTGISLRLEKGDNPSYRDIARWARTSAAMVEDFYDQTHPRRSAERVAGFRKREPKKRAPRPKARQDAKK